MGKVNKGMSKKKESAWLGRWTQLGNEVKFHDHSSGGDSKELTIRDEDKEVLPFPMFKVSQKRDYNTTKDEVGSSSKANNRMPWMYAQGANNNVQEKTTQNLLELMRPVRFYATVDSVQRVSGEMDEDGGHNHQLLKGSMKLKGKIYGRYLDLFPNHQHKGGGGGGARLESLESSKDTQEDKNESSAETDTLDMDKLHMLHLSGSIASSSTKGKGRKGESVVARTEIPDMNEEPPVVMDEENSVDGGHQGEETSNSATQSMNVEHFLSRDCKRVRLEQEPEASSRWVKRLKRNSFDSHDETKSLMKIEEEGNSNNNNLFLEILKSGINNLQPRNQEPATSPQIKGGDDEVTLMHPWIQRWCKKKDEGEGGEDVRFEGEKEKEMEKKQYPSIAAMALMGKALTGFNPYGLRKTDSLMVWNARDLR